ncbi:hypothetical protein ACF0H5_017351 [Mactra antiquata]
MKFDNAVKWLADGYRYKLFEEKEFKETKIKATDKDNFILHPKDDTGSYVEFDVGGQSSELPPKPKPTQRRIKSASHVRLQDRPWRQTPKPKYPDGFVPRRRPASAVTPKTGASSNVNTPRRIKSAGSSRTLAESVARETVEELRKGFALVNKLYENDYRGFNVRLHPASPAPDYRYFDRHSRCYNHTHAHRQSYTDRPQRACELYLESCGSRAVSPARPDDPNVQPQRYIDYHRPRTAPGTRRELQYIPRPSYVYRGHTPHFCNFVQQVSLHSRQANCTDSTGIPDSEFDDEEFIMESADGRLINKYRKSSTASSRGSLHGLTQVPNLDDYECDTGPDSIPEIKEDTQPSGTEGRPGSPSSLDGDSLRDLDSQQPITGVAYTGTSIPEEDDNIKDQTTNTSVNDWDKQSEGHNSNNEKTGHVDGGSDANNRIPSPRQPPPSPEPIKQKLKKSPSPVPLPVTSSESTKKRSCINKKTKKPVERKRKMKQIEETKVPETVKVEETPPTEETTNENDSSLGKIDLKVPELPSNLDNKDKTKKEKSKVKKHLIETEDDLLKPDPNDILNEQMKLSRTEFDWSNMDSNGTEEVKRQPNIKSWIQGRLALSQQSSRFELPMDMKNLEKMTPQEYIRKHCIITSRRQNLYQKIFLKNKDKSQAILFKDLDRSLKDVLVNTITSEQIHEVLNTLQVDENTKVDYKLFAGMAAYAERVLYPSFVTAEYLERLIELEIAFGLFGTEDTQDMPEYQKEKIECADFCALPWKLHGVKVNPEMKKLLEQIS